MTTFDLLKTTRKNILGLVEGLSTEQLNKIPEGFSNNLIWNVGHVIATMELLTYGLAGLRLPSGKEFINAYRKGTKPETEVDKQEIDRIFIVLSTSAERLGSDFETLDFGEYKTYPSSYGVTLTSVEDALTFNNMHEAMHIGAMIALKKLV